METELASQEPSFRLPPPLDVTRMGDYEIVHVGATPIAQYRVSDLTARRHVMVQLAEAAHVPGQEIARRFGVTPVYVSQLRGRYRSAGSRVLTARRTGPKGPSKVTAAIEARVRALRGDGLSYHAIADALADQRLISYQTVRRLLLQAPEVQLPLAAEALAVEEPPISPADESVAAPAPVAADVPEGDTRYAGAMLLHVALTQLGLWSVFQSLGASVGRTALRVNQVVGLVALGFALRLRSIEGFKTAMRRDFGRVLGLRVAPGVQTLRTRLRALAESVDPASLMRMLAAAWIHLEPVWEGAYYVDGHFCPYRGGRPLPKAWNAKRRLVEPGQTDLYVHDATGRVLFFVNRPFNDQLAKAVPQLLAEIRALVPPDQPVLLVFDRGGYSGQLFHDLTGQQVRFITYLKGRAARRRFPADRFVRRWWQVEDPAAIQRARRVVYRIFEKGTRLRHAGVIRTLIVEDEDAQIPVLTNCVEMSAAKVVHLLKMRWRQENSFKYLSAHYGVEQLIQHDATPHRDDRLVANPRRAQVRQQITALQTEVVLKEADLGRARRESATLGPRERRRAREIATLEGRLARLEQRLARTPAKVPAATLTGSATRATMNTDRRNLVNAIKIATYNAERLLARHFFRHYKDPRDWFTVFRAVLHLPGSVMLDGQTVRVTLTPPDQPRVKRALAAMLDDINRTNPRLFGAGPKLRFVLAA
jgi:transposase